ncbi:MAG: arginase family protein [Microcella sp.]|nr:MAG: arginase family protein [Microcella sp.]
MPDPGGHTRAQRAHSAGAGADAGGLAHDPLWPRAGDWPAWAPGSRADAVLVGIPTWRTSLSPGQTHTTPTAIRDALRYYSADALLRIPAVDRSLVADEPSSDRNERPIDGELARLRVLDAGDVLEPDGAGEAAATARVAEIASAASLVIVLGGDNAATVPAALGAWGDRIATAGLVTLDAHHDLRDGESNGSPVRRLLEAGLAGERVSQLGIEPLANSRAYAARAAEHGITVVSRAELLRTPIDVAMSAALHRAASAGGPVHVDLDLDVCDRSVAPGCPASVPGGLSAIELRTAARLAGAHPSVTSIDLTELDAARDSADRRTVRLAALCVLEAIAGFATRAGTATRQG